MKTNLTKSVIVLSLIFNLVFAQPYKVYTGLLHAHTSISDGSGTPEEAYKMAKQAGLNFFALTEHNHIQADGTGERKDGILIAKDHNLYNGSRNVSVNTSGGNTVVIKPLIKAAKDATTESFLAIWTRILNDLFRKSRKCARDRKCVNNRKRELQIVGRAAGQFKSRRKKSSCFTIESPRSYGRYFC
jgi:hypothetical protein